MRIFVRVGDDLLSGETFDKVYGLPAADAPMPFSQPGIVTIPLGFLTLVVVSLFTGDRDETEIKADSLFRAG